MPVPSPSDAITWDEWAQRVSDALGEDPARGSKNLQQIEARVRDQTADSIGPQDSVVDDGSIESRPPSLLVDLYDETLVTGRGLPERVRYAGAGGVRVFPSAQAMERLTAPTGAGNYARTSSSNWWKVFLSEYFLQGSRLVVRLADPFYVFDLPDGRLLPAKIRVNNFDGSYKLTAQRIDQTGTMVAVGAYATPGDLYAKELNGVGWLAKDVKALWMPWTGRLNAGGKPLFFVPSAQTFLGKITGQTNITADKQWTYTFVEVYPQADPYASASGASFSTVSGGRSGTAYNGIEAGNSATVHGNGVTFANLTGSFKVQPIKVGDVVEVTAMMDVAGNVKYIISKMNGVDGAC